MLTAQYPESRDVLSLVANMRDADREEVMYINKDSSMVRLIDDSIDKSTGVLAVRSTLHDSVVCIFGFTVDPNYPRIAVPWMLSTNLIHLPANQIRLCRWGKMFIDAIMQEHLFMANMIHGSNAIALRWITSMGFEVAIEAPKDINGGTFYAFRKRQPSVMEMSYV